MSLMQGVVRLPDPWSDDCDRESVDLFFIRESSHESSDPAVILHVTMCHVKFPCDSSAAACSRST